jgi:hypothetical protein
MTDKLNSGSKKTVFLFGAGAVLDWGAPLTICTGTHLTFKKEHGTDKIENRVCCLTHLMTAVGFKSKDGQRVSQKIFDLLTSKNSESNKSVTFETIIDFLEELFNYYASNNSKLESFNLFSFIDITNLVKDLFYFEITNKTEKSYTLNIPESEFDKIDQIPIEIHPEQKYCELLVNNLLHGIIGHVSKYSYHTKGHSVIYEPVNKLINKSFVKWCKKYVDKNSSLRMYTLNYDRIFKILLQDEGINVFEGFDLNTSDVAVSQYLAPNLLRIVSDFDCNVFYNLHGSAYWYFTDYNQNQLPGYQFYLEGAPEMNNPSTVIEIERNKRQLLSNIITGYQKVLKTALSPFRQMLAAFDRDCIEADFLFIIGYSYADEHINDIIRNARKFNPKVEIVLINPSFDDGKFMFDFLLHWGRPTGMIYQNAGDHIITSKDYKVKIIQKTFIDFLISCE